MRDRFIRAIAPVVPTNAALHCRLYEGFVCAYSAQGRHYHNLEHIEECLWMFDTVAHGAQHPKAVQAALFYHDIVYVSGSKDNEMRSADVAAKALRECGHDGMFVRRVVRYILATKKHDGKLVGHDEQIVADIDLSGLGADWATFKKNTENVRREFAQYSDEQFRSDRVALWRKMLARNSLYYGPKFAHLFEARARENITRELGELAA